MKIGLAEAPGQPSREAKQDRGEANQAPLGELSDLREGQRTVSCEVEDPKALRLHQAMDRAGRVVLVHELKARIDSPGTVDPRPVEEAREHAASGWAEDGAGPHDLKRGLGERLDEVVAERLESQLGRGEGQPGVGAHDRPLEQDLVVRVGAVDDD